MSTDSRPSRHHLPRGALTYLQLPTTDLDASIAFYASVLGWHGEAAYGSFEGSGLIGQWTTELEPATDGPVLWFTVEDLYPTLQRVVDAGGVVRDRPALDQRERWLVEVDDPSGNRIGLVAPVGTARPQTMLMVRDVEASSRWYQQLLGLTSDHGGPDYERLLADGELVLQLHHEGTDHHHGPVGDPSAARGNGVLVWFGEVGDFDGVVERAALLGAEVVNAPHRNPPAGDGNGPGHREIWVRDPDGYVVAVASPDGEAWEL
jgi:predicted enzyme related to lactoylglutathione lyase